MRWMVMSDETDKLQGLAFELERCKQDVSYITNGNLVEGELLVRSPKKKLNVIDLVKTIQPDAIIFGSSIHCSKLEKFREFGIPLIGICEFSDILETSPAYVADVLRTYDINHTQQELDGMKVNVEGWWDGKHLGCCNASVTHRSQMNGGLGFEHGCSGIVLKRVMKESALVLETIGKLIEYLKDLSYLGPVRTSVTVNERIIVKSLDLSFGWDSLPAVKEVLPCSFSKFLRKLIEGNILEELNSDVVVGVRLTFPPYPFILNFKGTNKISGVDRGKWKHLWPFQCRDYDVKEREVKSGQLFGVATAHAWSIEEARGRLYHTTLGSIEAKALQYRTDIGMCGEGRMLAGLP